METKKVCITTISCLLAGITVIGLMLLTPAYRYQVGSTECRMLLIECCVLFAAFYFAFRCLADKHAVIVAGAIILVFCYLHVVLIPMAVVFLYGSSLILTGRAIRKTFGGAESSALWQLDFLTGCGFEILLCGVLSLWQMGSIQTIRTAWCVVSLSAAVLLIFWKGWRKGNGTSGLMIRRPDGEVLHKPMTAALLAAIIVCALIQVGRTNLAQDYDSIWYGLRPEYVLDPQNSIFQDLGLIESVYTYPKGYEILMLPISGLSSYAFLSGSNVFIGVALWVVIYQILRIKCSGEISLAGTALCAAIPGISNMFLAVKPDTLTLFMQVCMIYFALRYVHGEKDGSLGGLVGSFVFSLACKPTSVVFSTALFLVLALFTGRKIIRDKDMASSWKNDGVSLLFACAGLLVTVMRTWSIVGIPMTSVLSSVFTALGFETHAPYSLQRQLFSKSFAEILTPDGILASVMRLAHIWLLPNTEETDHISIAWGGPITALLTILVLAYIVSAVIRRNKVHGSEEHIILGAFISVFVLSIAAMILLTKPDGNYFELLYAVCVLAFCMLIWEKDKTCLSKAALSLLLVVSMAFSGMSGWAWCSRFYPVTPVNKGVYEHKQVIMEELKSEFPQILSVFLKNPNAAVSSIGEHTFICKLPVITEAWQTVAAFGDPEVTNSVDSMERYLLDSHKKYLFVQKDYLDTDSPETEIIVGLIQRGLLKNGLFENGYFLAEISMDNTEETVSEELFLRNIVQYAPNDIDKCNNVAGYSRDHWAGPLVEVNIAAGDQGLLVLDGYYTQELTGTEQITVYCNGTEIMQYHLVTSEIHMEIPCGSNAEVCLKLEANFSFSATPPDVRTLSYQIYSLKGI